MLVWKMWSSTHLCLHTFIHMYIHSHTLTPTWSSRHACAHSDQGTGSPSPTPSSSAVATSQRGSWKVTCRYGHAGDSALPDEGRASRLCRGSHQSPALMGHAVRVPERRSSHVGLRACKWSLTDLYHSPPSHTHGPVCLGPPKPPWLVSLCGCSPCVLAIAPWLH